MENSRVSHLDKVWARTQLFSYVLWLIGGVLIAVLSRFDNGNNMGLILAVMLMVFGNAAQIRTLRIMITATTEYVDQKTSP